MSRRDILVEHTEARGRAAGDDIHVVGKLQLWMYCYAVLPLGVLYCRRRQKNSFVVGKRTEIEAGVVFGEV